MKWDPSSVTEWLEICYAKVSSVAFIYQILGKIPESTTELIFKRLTKRFQATKIKTPCVENGDQIGIKRMESFFKLQTSTSTYSEVQLSVIFIK